MSSESDLITKYLTKTVHDTRAKALTESEGFGNGTTGTGPEAILNNIKAPKSRPQLIADKPKAAATSGEAKLNVPNPSGPKKDTTKVDIKEDDDMDIQLDDEKDGDVADLGTDNVDVDADASDDFTPGPDDHGDEPLHVSMTCDFMGALVSALATANLSEEQGGMIAQAIEDFSTGDMLTVDDIDGIMSSLKDTVGGEADEAGDVASDDEEEEVDLGADAQEILDDEGVMADVTMEVPPEEEEEEGEVREIFAESEEVEEACGSKDDVAESDDVEECDAKDDDDLTESVIGFVPSSKAINTGMIASDILEGEDEDTADSIRKMALFRAGIKI